MIPGNHIRQAARQAGFTLLEGLLAASLTMGLLIFAGQAMMDGMDKMTEQAAADHLRKVQAAVQRYMRGPVAGGGQTNYDAWDARLTLNGGAQRIPLADLKPAYLPAGFGCPDDNANCATPRNPLGDAYEIRVRKVQGGNAGSVEVLEVAIVTTGANERRELLTRGPAIAARAGAGAGAVNANGQLAGSFGGWTADLQSEFGFAPGAVLPGRVGALQGFEDSQIIGDYVRRNRVEGHPGANVMRTDLNMNRYTITDVGFLDARDIVVEGDIGSSGGGGSPNSITTMALDVALVEADQIVLPGSGVVQFDGNGDGDFDDPDDYSLTQDSLAALEQLFEAGPCEDDEYISRRSNGDFYCARGSLPAGMIMAFIPDPDSNQDVRDFTCPPGWVPYEDAEGRFIVGSGAPVDQFSEARQQWIENGRMGPAPPQPVGHEFAYGETGGRDRVTITPGNLPAGVWYDKGSGNSFVRSGSGLSLRRSSQSLNPAPVEVTPPYYGVSYCQKT